MATRDEIVDPLAGFALFADLSTPQLERVAHTFEEAGYPEGERILRQGLTGSAFHIILDGEAASSSTATSGRRWPAATSSARSRSCSASRRSPMSSRPAAALPRPRRARCRAVPASTTRR